MSKSFLEAVLAGQAQPDEIDDAIDAWHLIQQRWMGLHEWLGLTWEEYGRFVQRHAAFEEIVAEHRKRAKRPGARYCWSPGCWNATAGNPVDPELATCPRCSSPLEDSPR